MKFDYKNTARLSDDLVLEKASSLQPYIAKLKKILRTKDYADPEGFVNLAFDALTFKKVMAFKKQYTSPNLKYILNIGIGGSSLGAKAVYDACKGYYDVVAPTAFPKLIFLDTNDTDYLFALQKLLTPIKNKDELLINAISKSGTTTETMANLEIIFSFLKFGKERLVLTTDYDSKLWQVAVKEKIAVLPIPKAVGGRYGSIFSAVGLFPLVCAKLDGLKLLAGAMSITPDCTSQTITKNPAALSAAVLYLQYKKGMPMHNTYFFNPQLESFGRWYTQLLAESCGKDGQGITPTVSIGSADLHSTAQLYLSGPKDKYFTFVYATKSKGCIEIPHHSPFSGLVESIADKTAQQIMCAIHSGVKLAFFKNKLPFSEIQLAEVTEFELGAFAQFKMFEVIYLAQLLGVNAFDQPGVEQYKIEVKQILAKTF